MTSSHTTPLPGKSGRRVNEWKRFFRTLFGRKIVAFGAIVIVLFILTAIFAPIMAPYGSDQQNYLDVLAKPSLKHLLGTDQLGRDVLSRIIYGSRSAIVVGLITVLVSAVIGLALGLIAGYVRGLLDPVIMRSMDTLMAIPMILLAVTIAALLGGGLQNVVIALGIALIPTYARLMYGQVLSIKQLDYVVAIRTLGGSNLRIMFKHIVPNCFAPIIVLMTMQIGTAILSEASLSFLGIGIKPPDPAWGSMVSEGYTHLLETPVFAIAPGVAIMLVVFAFNMVGDGLRDALDPKLRGTL